MTLNKCPKCGETFLLDEEGTVKCDRCGVEMIQVCEWCEMPERECRCRKDEIEDK